MELEVTFPGGLRVDAHAFGHTIVTDQPLFAGGGNEGPAPFTLFLASIGTCAGIYVLQFCKQRGIPTDGVRIVQRLDFDPATRLPRRVELDIKVPPEFPVHYHKALVHAANICAVKQTLQNPPQFDTRVSVDGAQALRA